MNGDHRLAVRQRSGGPVIDEQELSVPILVRAAFPRLAVALQAVAHKGLGNARRVVHACGAAAPDDHRFRGRPQAPRLLIQMGIQQLKPPLDFVGNRYAAITAPGSKTQ